MGQEVLGLSEIVEEFASFAAADNPADNIADQVLEFILDPLLLKLADTLHDRLPRRLGGDSTEEGRVHFFLYDITDLDAGLNCLRLLHMDLKFGIAYRINYLKNRPGGQASVPGVNFDLELLTCVHATARCVLNGSDDR